jgi:glucokinase
MSGAQAQAIGVDVGGTKTAALRVAGDGEILAREVLPTPADDMEATLQTMAKAAKAVLSPEVRAIGVGAAGLVEAGTGRLIFAPNLAWRNALLTDHLWEAIGLPAYADNDNNVAAWGEYRHGAARGYRHLLFVGVGTGIGGGIVSDGKLLRGAHGFAAEIGHIIVEPGGPLCGCGNHGCWEQVASGHALTRAGRDAASQHPRSMIARRCGGDPSKVTGPLVTEAARAGDPVARGILARVG